MGFSRDRERGFDRGGLPVEEVRQAGGKAETGARCETHSTAPLGRANLAALNRRYV